VTAGFVPVSLPESGLESDDGDCGVIGHGLAGQTLEHGSLPVGAARFAKTVVSQSANLVGADDDCSWKSLGDHLRFGERQAFREGGSGLAGQPGLVDVGARNLEGQAEAGE